MILLLLTDSLPLTTITSWYYGQSHSLKSLVMVALHEGHCSFEVLATGFLFLFVRRTTSLQTCAKHIGALVNCERGVAKGCCC